MTINFADISHHNGTPNLAAYKAAGHERIVIKATEGTGFTDPMFKANWQAAGKLGLKRVAYHFARAKFNGANEFDHFFAVVKDAGGFGPNDSACLDVEDPDTPARAAAEAREFVNRAVAKGITRGLIYTYNYYGVHEHIEPSLFPVGWRHMWMADYTAGQADSDIELGAGWTRDQVVARQYTDKANVAGIGSTDYNRLIHDWLTVVDAVSTDDPEEDWMADISSETLSKIAAAVWAEPLQGEMNAPERAGQVLVHARVWAALIRDKLPGLADRAVEVQEALATLVADSGKVSELSDDVLSAISAAISQELSKRLAIGVKVQ